MQMCFYNDVYIIISYSISHISDWNVCPFWMWGSTEHWSLRWPWQVGWNRKYNRILNSTRIDQDACVPGWHHNTRKEAFASASGLHRCRIPLQCKIECFAFIKHFSQGLKALYFGSRRALESETKAGMLLCWVNKACLHVGEKRGKLLTQKHSHACLTSPPFKAGAWPNFIEWLSTSMNRALQIKPPTNNQPSFLSEQHNCDLSTVLWPGPFSPCL